MSGGGGGALGGRIPCDCIKKTTQAVLDSYKSAEDAAGKPSKAIMQDIVIPLSVVNKGGTRTAQRVLVEFEHTNKKGKKTTRTRMVTILHGFCPFCGLSWKSTDPAA